MQRIQISKASNIILVDASYYVFHRYNATLKWYSYSKLPSKGEGNSEVEVKDGEDESDDLVIHEKNAISYPTIHENAEFVDAFKRHFVKDIAKWKKQWKVASNSNIVFCSDCPRCEIWRNDLFAHYKGTRVPSITFNANIFTIFYTMIRELNFNILSGPRLEADDIAYLVTKRLLSESFDKNIVIITNDNDYLQMCDMSSNICLHNLLGKNNDLKKRSKGSPQLDLMIKILMGDVSDNIPPVCSKMGPKTAFKVAQMSDEERLAFVASKKCEEQYAKNETLVSFAKIPEGLAQHFVGNSDIIYI